MNFQKSGDGKSPEGYKPIRTNHLGDWGTQFGKSIVANGEAKKM
ncbi:arginine--tRNA ligase domain-containing protein [Thermoflavimicrobium dichotomicum]|nr:arginine--tRNA ligase [Thermoflavimicrobium dichotomicum]